MRIGTMARVGRGGVALAAVVLSVLLAGRAPAQSLWGKPGASRRGAIADHTALEIGDIVTVVVSEAQTLQDNGKMETSKDSSLDSKLEVFDIKPNAFSTLPALKYSSSRSANGESKYSQQGSFQTRLSAVVLDVKANGALLIEGRRTIHLDGDVKEMRVRGLVRPVDIAGDNSVSSDRIADADILYDSEGGRSNVVHKNWFEKLLDVIWPF